MTESLCLTSTTRDNMRALARLVIKQGVGLGGLTDDQRMSALALAWAVMPAQPMTERQVNDQLKLALSGVVSFLDTDHVELRRWLVDTGWLARDGFGREYRRQPAQACRPEAAPWAEVLQNLDVSAWVAEQKAQHHAQREARRQSWQASPESHHTP
jgi:hypothetical protein